MNDFLVLRIWAVFGKQNDFARQQEFSPKAFPSVIFAFINCIKDALRESRNVPVTGVRPLSIKEGLGHLLGQSSSETPWQHYNWEGYIRWRAFLNGLANLELWIRPNPAFLHEPIPLRKFAIRFITYITLMYISLFPSLSNHFLVRLSGSELTGPLCHHTNWWILAVCHLS